MRGEYSNVCLKQGQKLVQYMATTSVCNQVDISSVAENLGLETQSGSSQDSNIFIGSMRRTGLS